MRKRCAAAAPLRRPGPEGFSAQRWLPLRHCQRVAPPDRPPSRACSAVPPAAQRLQHDRPCRRSPTPRRQTRPRLQGRLRLLQRRSSYRRRRVHRARLQRGVSRRAARRMRPLSAPRSQPPCSLQATEAAGGAAHRPTRSRASRVISRQRAPRAPPRGREGLRAQQCCTRLSVPRE